MQKAPNWLRPAIATTSVVAVAAASVVVGSFFAPAPAAAPTEPTEQPTASFPVLQPVGYGDTWLPDTEGEASPEQGARSVPVDADGIPNPSVDLEDAVRALSDSPDPAADTFDLDILGGPEDSSGSDDPCAPSSSDLAADCPEGLRGATFSIISPDSLWAMLRANPPVEITNPYEIAYCPAAEVGPRALRYSIVTNAPGAISLTYWPRGDESSATTINLASSPVQTAEWEAALADADDFEGDWTTLQHCATLDGLEKYVNYDYELHVEDVLGRTFTSSLVRPFSLPDDRTAPSFRVTPLGSNAIHISAPHQADTEVRFNVQVLDPGDTDDCSITGDRLQLVDPSFGPTTVDVSPEYLAEHGYLPGYTKRSSIGVYVPSGSTIIVCAGVYEHDRPGWLWHEAQHQYSMVVQTPGGLRPVVTVDHVDVRPEYDDTSITVKARFDGTGDHLTCHLYSSSSASRAACGDDPHDITRGDLWVTTAALLDGAWTRYSALLPLGSVYCDPGCAVPDTAWYSVPVKLQERPGETCGSGIIGPCPDTLIGTARIRVDWTLDPAADYGEYWNFAAPQSASIEHELHPLPQMDWLEEPEIIESPTPNTSAVRFTLRVDRPVTYRVDLQGECSTPTMNRFVEGETSTSTHITFRNLCKGERYALLVTLTDSQTGATNVFGGTDGQPWPYRSVVTPGFTYNVVLGQKLGLKEDAHQLKIKQFRVRVDGQSIEPSLPERQCAMGTTFTRPPSAVLESASLGQLVTVEVTVQLAGATGGSEGQRAYCDSGVASGTPVYTFTAEVSLDDLLTGAVITAPDDAPYVTEVTLRLGQPT